MPSTESRPAPTGPRSTTESTPLIRLAGAALLVAALFGVFLSPDHGSAFLDARALFITVGGTAGLLLVAFGGAGFTDLGRALWSRSIDEPAAGRAVRFCRFGAVSAFLCGFAGTIVGLVLMLTSLTDPSVIGPGAATALLAELYGILLATLFLLAGGVVTSRRDIMAPAVDGPSSHGVTTTACATGLGSLFSLGVILLILIGMTQGRI